MSKAIEYFGQSGLLVSQTRERVYVILDESRIHLRRLPIAALKDIEETPGRPVEQIERRLRQAARRQGVPVPEALTDAT